MIKCEFKELRMNVNNTFWKGKPSDNERRWRKLEVEGCFLVLACDRKSDRRPDTRT